ncbi:hypothetical protein GPECTOR_17g918 [Gonium pectorale]|uniref:Alpha-aminoacylpeptide hydrolase n=1 Tax=Gonium pectorale TaxID=33097 RepID=A0A150GKA9_GONPE|nr:hypothetical protein GPECTOR_17g918 [Gonium pectorale]|eukprot:KXZ50279.1 hypothetical protein GPECTOR_17g918 [Gonium pectorale]
MSFNTELVSMRRDAPGSRRYAALDNDNTPPPTQRDREGGGAFFASPGDVTNNHDTFNDSDLLLSADAFHNLPDGSPPAMALATNGASCGAALLGELAAAEEYVVGSVNISVALAVDTQCVVLHGVGMALGPVVYRWKGQSWTGSVISPSGPDAATSLQQLVLRFDSPLPLTGPVAAAMGPGGANSTGNEAGQLSLCFAYRLQDGLDGIYRSTYTDASGDTHAIVSTQFESIAARKAFPCFDEPRLKATFSSTLVTPGGREGDAPLAVLSNTAPLERTPLPDGRVRTVFAATPRMSTYLLAFVAGPLASRNTTCQVPQPGAPVQLAAWATPHKVGQLEVALAVGCSALSTYTAATATAYPLPKLDLVGLPNFAAGAMENFGCITFRESALLTDPSSDDISSLLWIATVISHEISHQWFGNMVTMADWTELWLNEGFATYLELLAASDFRPQYQYWALAYTDMDAPALSYDAMSSVHPMSRTAQPISSLPDIDNMFDDISYAKGGAVLRMLRAFLQGDRLGSGAELLLRRRSLLQQRRSQEPLALGRLQSQQHQGQGESPAIPPQASGGPVPPLGPESVLPPGIAVPPASPAVASPSTPPPIAAPPVFPGAQNTSNTDSSTDAAPPGEDLPPAPPSPEPANGTSASTTPAIPPPGSGLGPSQPPSSSVPPGPALPPGSHAGGPSMPPAPASTSSAWPPAPASTSSAWPPAPAFDPKDYGSDPLLAALRVYLKENMYGSTTATVLWDTLSRVTGLPISSWMSGWTYSPNYPVLQVSLGTTPYGPHAAITPATPGGLAAAAGGASPPPDTAPSSPGLAAGGDGTEDAWSPPPPSSAPPASPAGGYLNVRQVSITGATCNRTDISGLSPRWWVPLSFRLPGVPSMRWAAFNACSAAVPFTSELLPPGPSGPARPPYVLVNPGRYGYYRTNYSRSLWDALAEAASDPEAIPPADLAGLLDDSWQLNWLDMLRPTVFMNLTAALGRRLLPEYEPWSVALSALRSWQRLLDSAAMLPKSNATAGAPPPPAAVDGEGVLGGEIYGACARRLGAFTQDKLTAPLLANLTLPLDAGANGTAKTAARGLNFTVDGSAPLTASRLQLRLLRPLALVRAAGAAVSALTGPGAANTGTLMLQLPQQEPFRTARVLLLAAYGELSNPPGTPSTLHPDIRGAAYTVASMGDPLAWSNIKAMYQQSSDATERDRLLAALSQTPDGIHIRDTLKWTLDADPVTGLPLQDVGSLLHMVGARGGDAHRRTWDFVLRNTDGLLRRFGSGPAAASSASYSLGRALKELAKGFVSSGRVDDVLAWSAKYPGLMDSGLEAVLRESIARNRKWLAGPARDLCAWLQQQHAQQQA